VFEEHLVQTRDIHVSNDTLFRWNAVRPTHITFGSMNYVLLLADVVLALLVLGYTAELARRWFFFDQCGRACSNIYVRQLRTTSARRCRLHYI